LDRKVREIRNQAEAQLLDRQRRLAEVRSQGDPLRSELELMRAEI
jgi:hypothetical protein